MILTSFSEPALKNEKEFLLRQAEIAKKALFQTGKKVLEAINPKEVTKKYPFYSTGAAALLGYAAGEKLNGLSINPQSSYDSHSPIEKASNPSSVGSAIFPMIFTLAVDLLKEAFIPPASLQQEQENPETSDDQNTVA